MGPILMLFLSSGFLTSGSGTLRELISLILPYAKVLQLWQRYLMTVILITTNLLHITPLLVCYCPPLCSNLSLPPLKSYLKWSNLHLCSRRLWIASNDHSGLLWTWKLSAIERTGVVLDYRWTGCGDPRNCYTVFYSYESFNSLF